jgi:hypothetical protein
MNGRWNMPRLLEAIGDLCNGTIDENVGRELDELLASDAQARRVYTNYMWTHACLYAEGGSLAPHTATNENGEIAVGDDLHAALHSSDAPSVDRGKWTSWLWLAAAIVGVAAFSSWATARWSDRQLVEQLPAAEQLAVPAAEAVARITGTHNCIWSDAQTNVGYGSAIYPGQRIELAEGLAEITFDDGATLLLEGPATFHVDGSDKVALHAGRMAAVVPQRAKGFHVHTATLDVFDVGTEFGLVAQESGGAEVHVFNGLVKADVLDGNGRAFRRLELNAAEAARVSPLSTSVVEFPANDAGFVRNITPINGPHDGLLAEEAFRYPEGPLEAQNGGFGWAGPWFTTSADDEDAGPDSNRVTPGSLAVQGIVPVGNRAVIEGNRNRIRRQLATSVGGVFDAEGLVENQDEIRLVGRDGKHVYLSFVQRVSRVNDGFYGLELHRGDGNGNRVLCIGNGADGAGYGATSNVNVYGAKNLPALGVESDEPNFFVIKVSFGVDNRDTVEIYRNPASLRDERECQPDAVLRGNFAFDRISLANFDGSKIHEVDELRVGAHFLAVTGRWGNNQGRLRQPIVFLNRLGSHHSADLKTGWINRFSLVASSAQ